MAHRFDQSNERSHSHDGDDWVDAAYRRFFVNAVKIEVVPSGDSAEQRAGIDRKVTMRSGKLFCVDDKFREEDWGDIALERFSDRERRTAGWVQKLNSSLCDFINYAVVPTRTCTFLARQPLWCAWQKYGREWIERAEAKEPGFKVCLAPNVSWVTESIAIPYPTLHAAMCEVSCLRPDPAPPPPVDVDRFDEMRWQGTREAERAAAAPQIIGFAPPAAPSLDDDEWWNKPEYDPTRGLDA